MPDLHLLPDEPLPVHLLNTELMTGRGRVDLLADVGGLEAWLQAVGRPERPATPTALAALREARSAIRGVLEDGDDGSARRRLNDVLARGRRRGELDATGPTEVVEVPDEDDRLPWEAASTLLGLLRTDRHRLRPCDGHDCVLWFYDSSRSGRRQWCSMATCGNRAKARRHHARARGGAASEW